MEPSFIPRVQTAHERLASNLKALRIYHKRTQAEAAEHFRIKRSTYSSYENGAAEPNMDLLVQFSKHYEVSLDTLLRRSIVVATGLDTLCHQQSRLLIGESVH